MKRFVSLMVAVMAFSMVLTLTACGDEKTEGDATQTAGTQQGQTVDLAALRTKILTDCKIADYVEVETPALQTAYGVDPAQVVASAGFNATTGAAFPEEVVMVQATDETAAADIKSKLEGRLANIAETAASYDPDSLALAQRCTVVSNGVYVGLFFSQQYDTMVAAFQEAIA